MGLSSTSQASWGALARVPRGNSRRQREGMELARDLCCMFTPSTLPRAREVGAALGAPLCT